MENDFKFDNPDEEHDWQKEWVGMPEFIQVDKESKKSVVVHFENWEDMKAFGELVGREITPNTKSFFFPVKPKGTPKVYKDEA
jgi:hypothetical protein